MEENSKKEENYIQDESAELTLGENPLLLKFFSAFPAFLHKNYRLYFSGQLISLTGTWLQTVAQGWLVLELTHSAFWVGAVSALGFLPVLFFGLFAGVIVDRFPKKNILIITQTCSFFFALIMGLLVVFNLADLLSISILVFLMGAVTAFDMPARQSFTAEIVDRKDLTSAIALNSGIYNVARVIGPSLAGILIALYGTGGAFIINAISFLAVIISLLFMKTKSIFPKIHQNPIQAIKEGISYSFSNSGIKLLLIMASVAAAFGWSYIAIMPVVVENVFHMGAGALGYIYAISGLGAVLGTTLVSIFSKKINPAYVIFFGNTLFAITITLFTFTNNLMFATPLLFLSGFGIIAEFATINSTIQHMVDDKLRGRVMSIYSLMFVGFMPFGSFTLGIIAQNFGPLLAIQTGAFITFIFGIYFFLKRSVVKVAA